MEMGPRGPRDAELSAVAHMRLYRAFCGDPEGFADAALRGDEDMLY